MIYLNIMSVSLVFGLFGGVFIYAKRFMRKWNIENINHKIDLKKD